MSHHSNSPFDKKVNQENILSDLLKPASQDIDLDQYANKQFPAGKLNEDDEGIIAFRVGTKDNTLVIDFGKQVHWIGLTKKEVYSLIDLLRRRVAELE